MKPRPENWPELLAVHFAEWSAYPFAYGSRDCVHFAAAWLERLGYPDPLSGLPNWSSPLSAARLWKSLGGFEHGIGAQLGALGCQQITPAKAMRGDLVLVRNGPHGRQVLAIADGADAVRACAAARAISPDVHITTRTTFLSQGLEAMRAGANSFTVEEIATAHALAREVTQQLASNPDRPDRKCRKRPTNTISRS